MRVGIRPTKGLVHLNLMVQPVDRLSVFDQWVSRAYNFIVSVSVAELL